MTDPNNVPHRPYRAPDSGPEEKVASNLPEPILSATPIRRSSHYAALDGLRGIAALSVVAMHTGAWLGCLWIAPNSILAVDFFFCLSGYVLCFAYRPKIDQGMSALTFFKVRLIRLMPIIIIGTLVSAAYSAARHMVTHDDVPTSELGLFTLLGTLSLPWLGTSKGVGGGVSVFPLNFPQYTLFLELVVNLAWAALRRLDSLVPAVAIAVLGYIVCAFRGMEGAEVWDFWTGFPRVFAGFYAGAAIYHARRRWPVLTDRRLGRLFVPLLVLTLVLLLLPVRLPFAWRWLWCVLVSPALVITGTQVELNGRVRRAALMLGALSYPVYGLHWPILVWVNGVYQQLHGAKNISLILIVFPAVLIGSWIVLRYADEPIRARLAPGRA